MTKKLIRKYQDPIQPHKDYIDVLLRLAGYRLSDLHVSILAHSSARKALTPETKKEIAAKFNTTLQVISNAITKLRKLQLLLKNNVNPKLTPERDNGFALTIYFAMMTPPSTSSTSSTGSTQNLSKLKQNKETKEVKEVKEVYEPQSTDRA
jgi:hypothetical protein